MRKFADGTIGVTINGRVHVGKPSYIRRLQRDRQGKTWAERVADKAMPARSVEEIKNNWADASDEKVLEQADGVLASTGQTELSRNLRQAFREMLRERGLR